MTGGRITHGDFTIERVYDAPVSRVFSAYVGAEARYRWLVSSDGWTIHDYSPAERAAPGAREFSRFSPPGSDMALTNETFFLEVQQDRHVVLAYAMTMDGAPLSSSLLTAEFEADGSCGTRMILTEQGAYHQGDAESRKSGFGGLLEQFAKELGLPAGV